MLNIFIVIGAICVCMGFLVFIAFWTERKLAKGKDITKKGWIYALSLGIYCSAWTYYGSVGLAATSGFLFLTIYLGPTLAIIFGWIFLRKLVKIKNEYRITNIADLIVARYGKSQFIGSLVTIAAIIGIAPYIALQLKAIVTTFTLIVDTEGITSLPLFGSNIGILIVLLLIIFTIMFGVRRLDPTERHEGMVMAVAVESIIQLVCFLAVGIFVVFFLFNGFGDLFGQLSMSSHQIEMPIGTDTTTAPYLTWATFLILAMSAILFLPRQFHIAVVENSDENHIRSAMWIFPLYMLLTNIFVFPIAIAGILKGLPIQNADSFVLALPISAGNTWLALAVFIGGFAAATSMIMISSMALSIMITNHLVLPVANGVKQLGFLQHHVLKIRWVAVAVMIFLGYFFMVSLGNSYALVNMGMISFAAALQFAPVIIGGIFWPQGNKQGALLGLGSGILLWFYTILLPAFVRSGWLSMELLEKGPFGIELLRPEQLFGIAGLHYLAHGTFWTLLFNIGLFIVGSIYFSDSLEEKNAAEKFVGILQPKNMFQPHGSYDILIDFDEKREIFKGILTRYLTNSQADSIIEHSRSKIGVDNEGQISVMKLAEFTGEIESHLSGIIGASIAHKVLNQSKIYTPVESKALKGEYGAILADLKIKPKELTKRINYYKEKEKMLSEHAAELQDKINKLHKEIIERKKVEKALKESEKKFRSLVETSSDWVWEVDKNGVYTYVSPKVKDLLGYEPEEVIGKSPFDFMPKREADKKVVDFQKYISLRQPIIGLINKNIHKNGEIVILDTNAVPIFDDYRNLQGYRGIDRDITNRIRAEHEIRDAHRKLEEYSKTLEKKVQQRTKELQVKTDSLEQLNLDLNVMNQELTATNEELLSTQEALEQSKMRIETQNAKLKKLDDLKSAFLNVTSHELRTPMSSIKGYVQMMLKEVFGEINEEQMKSLDIVLRNTNRLDNLIQDILDISRLESGTMKFITEKTHIWSMISDIAETMKSSADMKHIILQIEVDEEVPDIIIDQDRVKQVIINLVNNAIKFSPEHSMIIIRADLDEDYVTIAVQDQGRGIPRDKQDLVFKTFYQVDSGMDRKFGGAGLGLAISRGIILAHGGEIWVESEGIEGRGSTFKFTLPVIPVQDVEGRFKDVDVFRLEDVNYN